METLGRALGPIVGVQRSVWATSALTGDYLAFTQVDALRQLLHYSPCDASGAVDDTPQPGKVRVRVVQTIQDNSTERAFHPKV